MKKRFFRKKKGILRKALGKINKYKRIQKRRKFWEVHRPLGNKDFKIMTHHKHETFTYTIATINSANGLINIAWAGLNVMDINQMIYVKSRYSNCQYLGCTITITLEDTNALAQYLVGQTTATSAYMSANIQNYEPDMSVLCTTSSTQRGLYALQGNVGSGANRDIWLNSGSVKLLKPFKKHIVSWHLPVAYRGIYTSTATVTQGSVLGLCFPGMPAMNQPDGVIFCFFDCAHFAENTSGTGSQASISIGITFDSVIAYKDFIPQV